MTVVNFSLLSTSVLKALTPSPLLLSQFCPLSSLTWKTLVPAWVHILLLRTLNCWAECSKIKHVHIMPLLNPAVAGVQGCIWQKRPSLAPPPPHHSPPLTQPHVSDLWALASPLCSICLLICLENLLPLVATETASPLGRVS